MFVVTINDIDADEHLLFSSESLEEVTKVADRVSNFLSSNNDDWGFKPEVQVHEKEKKLQSAKPFRKKVSKSVLIKFNDEVLWTTSTDVSPGEELTLIGISFPRGTPTTWFANRDFSQFSKWLPE